MVGESERNASGLILPHGLGAIMSPPDERDFSIENELRYQALEGKLIPASYRVPGLPSIIFDQGASPMCVAYSAATEQATFDLADSGHNYLWDFGYFFRKIGGTPNGAIIRNALNARVSYGYPLQPHGSGNSAAAHRIKAYYAVPKTKIGVQRALMSHGVLVSGTPWFNSWFDPRAGGTLPPADYQVGSHAIVIVGWTAIGIRWRNTWGKDWGVDGECIIPWASFLHSVREVWKATDA